MKRYTPIAALAAMTLSLMAQQAIAAENKGSVSIKFAGEMNWSASCKFIKANGKERTIKRSGRGTSSIESLAIRNIDSGICVLTVPNDTQLKITFNSKGAIACPFYGAEPCMRVIASNGERAFSF